jgi:hypothetical protein
MTLLVACATQDEPQVKSVDQDSSVHLKGGPNAEPSFRDLGLALRASGELAGLGNGDILVTLTASGDVTATCTNPSDKNQPPGQNPAPITVTGEEAIPDSKIKNGNVSFLVTTTVPNSTIAGAPDCPNSQWTETITDIAFTTAVITVEQPMDTTVLTVNCIFSPATSDEPVLGSTVTCTQKSS